MSVWVAGWVRTMVAEGWLTEADAFEVQGTVDLVLGAVRRGEITEHFARLVITKLAKDKRKSWYERQRG